MRREAWLREMGVLEDKATRDAAIAAAFERFILKVGPHEPSVAWRNLPKEATVAHCAEWLRRQGWEVSTVDPYIIIALHPMKEEKEE